MKDNNHYEVNWSTFTPYILLGIAISYYYTYSWNSFFVVFVFIGIVSFVLSFFLCRYVIKGWYSKFPLAEITCACGICATNRKKNKRIISLVIVFGFILAFSIIVLPHFTMAENIKKQKILQELKLEFGPLKMDLRSYKETEYYDVRKFAKGEIVKNFYGDYYVINLKNILTSKKIYFAKGEYVIDDLDGKLIDALTHFLGEVYLTLDEKVECKIFIKGSADIIGHETFRRKFTSNYGKKQGFGEITYYKAIKGDLNWFVPEESTEFIKGEEYNNANLPNLRGKFIQYKIINSYPDLPIPIILEGGVDDRIGSEYRNVTMYLYVNWDKLKN